MNRVIRLALLQTVLFVSVVFFFYVAAYGVRAIFSADVTTGGATYVFAAASLVAMASTVQVLLRSGRPLYAWVAMGSSLVAAGAVFVQGIAPLLALLPTANSLAVFAFHRQRQRA